MRMTVNKESEMKDGLDLLHTSGITSAILGEGTEKSQSAYYRDLLNHQNIEASIVKTNYKDENGEKAVQELVEVRMKDGQSLLLNPSKYNGLEDSISQYNDGTYTKQTSFFKSLFSSNKSLPEGKLNISGEEILSSQGMINEGLIQKYNIREISQVSDIWAKDNSIDNQLKMIGLVGENLTSIQGNEAELLRTVRMNDGKEIEASKMLELLYHANGIDYTRWIGAEKEDISFELPGNDIPYKISPNNIYRNTLGDNIDTSSLFITEDRDAFYKSMTFPGDDTKTTEDCNKQMESKIKYSFMSVNNSNIPNIQESLKEGTSLEMIKKMQDIEHYSIKEISNQLGISDILEQKGSNQELKANAVIMAYLNENSYHYTDNNKEFQAVTMSDLKPRFLSDIQELFYIQNKFHYGREENNELYLRVNDKEYKWEYDFNPLLSKDIPPTGLSHQKLIERQSGELLNTSSLDSFAKNQIGGVIRLSERIPSSKNEIMNMVREIREGDSRVKSLDLSQGGPESQAFLLEKRINYLKDSSPEEYQDYLNVKDGRADYFETDNSELLKEYEEKVKSISSQIKSSSKTEEEQILTTMEYLRLNGRYENILMGEKFNIGTSLSQSAIPYAKGGEGVCASQAEYLKDILNEMGISTETETCFSGEANDNIMRSQKSNHLITRVRTSDGKSYVLDPTSYEGTSKTLAYTDKYTFSPASNMRKKIDYNLHNQGEDSSTINSELSNLSETERKKTALSAKLYPETLLDWKIKTPFGSKTLKEMQYQTLTPTEEEIDVARKKASTIVNKELGIDEISSSLNISEAATDKDKQSIIMGYIESNLLPMEDTSENIASRIVKVGDKSLELADILELLYLKNDIPYEINQNSSNLNYNFNLKIDEEPVNIFTRKAYKNDLSVEEQRNQLFEKEDGNFLDMADSIGKSISSMGNINKNFVDRYKVEGIHTEDAIKKAEQNTLEQATISQDEELEEDPRFNR